MAGEADTFLLIILACIFPPAAAAFVAGCGADLCLNILLTILGYLPGCFHAFWLILKRAEANEMYGYQNWRYAGMGEYVPTGQQAPPRTQAGAPYGPPPLPPQPPPAGPYPAGSVPAAPAQAPPDPRGGYAYVPPAAPGEGKQVADQKSGYTAPPATADQKLGTDQAQTQAPSDQKYGGDQAPPPVAANQKQADSTTQSTAPHQAPADQIQADPTMQPTGPPNST